MRLLTSLMLLLAVTAPICAQDANEKEAGEDLVDGWIIGANDEVIRMDTDGSHEVVQRMPGLRHFRVIPGTNMAIAGSTDGVAYFQDGEWQWISQGAWEQIGYSMNYESISVLKRRGKGSYTVHITQLKPDVKPLETYSLRSRQQGGLGSEKVSLGYKPDSDGPMLIPSATGELASSEGKYRYSPDSSAVPVFVTAGGKRLPVHFIAAGGPEGFAYGTVEISEHHRQWLERLYCHRLSLWKGRSMRT